jgi:hypothetical protein
LPAYWVIGQQGDDMDEIVRGGVPEFHDLTLLGGAWDGCQTQASAIS